MFFSGTENLKKFLKKRIIGFKVLRKQVNFNWMPNLRFSACDLPAEYKRGTIPGINNCRFLEHKLSIIHKAFYLISSIKSEQNLYIYRHYSDQFRI